MPVWKPVRIHIIKMRTTHNYVVSLEDVRDGTAVDLLFLPKPPQASQTIRRLLRDSERQNTLLVTVLYGVKRDAWRIVRNSYTLS